MNGYFFLIFCLIFQACFGSAGSAANQIYAEQTNKIDASSCGTLEAEMAIILCQIAILPEAVDDAFKNLIKIKPDNFSKDGLCAVEKNLRDILRRQPGISNNVPDDWQKALILNNPDLRALFDANKPEAQKKEQESRFDETKKFFEEADKKSFATAIMFIFLDPSKCDQWLGSFLEKLSLNNEIASKPVTFLVSKILLVCITYSFGDATKLHRFWWIQSTRDPELFLMVPRALMTGYKNEIQTLNAIALSQASLDIGLKLDHSKNLSFTSYNENFQAKSMLSVFEDIFITRSEYRSCGRADMPRWSLIFDGSSSKGGFYGIPAPEFKKILSFCADKIDTVFFSYAVCLAVGSISQEIFGDNLSEVYGSVYPFIILTNGIANDLLLIDYDSDYSRVPDLLLRNGPLKLAEISTSLFGKDLACRFCHVRFPYQGWFTSLDLKNNSFAIRKILAQTRNKPLYLNAIFKGIKAKENPVVMLYSPVIPFEINATDVNIHFIPMSTSRAYYFKSLIINCPKKSNLLEKYLPDIYIHSVILSYLENLSIYSIADYYDTYLATPALFWFQKIKLLSYKQDDIQAMNRNSSQDLVLTNCVLNPKVRVDQPRSFVYATIEGSPYEIDGDARMPKNYLDNLDRYFFYLSNLNHKLSDEDIYSGYSGRAVAKLYEDYVTKSNEKKLIIAKKARCLLNVLNTNKTSYIATKSNHGKYTAH